MPDLAHQTTAKVYRNSSLRIVLVEPAGSLNVGAIARVMKNMGLSHLTLVNPKCDPFGEEALRMAVHADDVLTSAKIVATVADALKGCQQVVATTARDRDLNLPVDVPKMGLQWLLGTEQSTDSHIDDSHIDDSHIDDSHIDDSHTMPTVMEPPSKALLFGPEDRGLSNAELIYAQRLINIPTNPAYASLNLAQAVALCCYELSQLMNPELFKGHHGNTTTYCPMPTLNSMAAQPDIHEVDSADIAPVEMLEGYYKQLEDVLLEIGYLYPHTTKRRMEKFRLLFNRSKLSPNEVAMLRGILRQIGWATQSATKFSDDDANT